MLNQKEAIAMIAVKDVHAAAKFYEGTLGLERADTEGDEVITYRSGSSRLNIYRSPYAGGNKATSAMWNVGSEIDSIAAELKARGVTFERYDLPGLTLQGDLYASEDGSMKVGWFRDPDGNILSIVSG